MTAETGLMKYPAVSVSGISIYLTVVSVYKDRTATADEHSQFRVRHSFYLIQTNPSSTLGSLNKCSAVVL